MAEIIVVANQKGGVAKTTTTFNLASSLEALGKRVLAVDFDHQGNLTSCLAKEGKQSIDMTIANLMNICMESEDEPELPDRAEYIYHCNGVDFIGANRTLSTIEAKLLAEAGGERTLTEIIEPLRDDYDYILIDTNPSLGILTINALAVADDVMITVSPQYFSMEGLDDLIKSIVKVRKRMNPKLGIAGICLTMCDFRTKLYRRVYEDLLEYTADRIRIYDAKIPYTVKVGESLYAGENVATYCATSPASIAYSELAKEVLGCE